MLAEGRRARVKGERGTSMRTPGESAGARQGPGGDRAVADNRRPSTAIASRSPAADPSGRFYARVAQAIARGAGLCAKARSGVIRVST